MGEDKGLLLNQALARFNNLAALRFAYTELTGETVGPAEMTAENLKRLLQPAPEPEPAAEAS